MYIHIYIHIYTYTCIHTYTYTYIYILYIYICCTIKHIHSIYRLVPSQRLFQGRETYSRVICDVGWFTVEHLTSNKVIMVMIQLLIEVSTV